MSTNITITTTAIHFNPNSVVSGSQDGQVFAHFSTSCPGQRPYSIPPGGIVSVVLFPLVAPVSKNMRLGGFPLGSTFGASGLHLGSLLGLRDSTGVNFWRFGALLLSGNGRGTEELEP